MIILGDDARLLDGEIAVQNQQTTSARWTAESRRKQLSRLPTGKMACFRRYSSAMAGRVQSPPRGAEADGEDARHAVRKLVQSSHAREVRKVVAAAARYAPARLATWLGEAEDALEDMVEQHQLSQVVRRRANRASPR